MRHLVQNTLFVEFSSVTTIYTFTGSYIPAFVGSTVYALHTAVYRTAYLPVGLVPHHAGFSHYTRFTVYGCLRLHTRYAFTARLPLRLVAPDAFAVTFTHGFTPHYLTRLRTLPFWFLYPQFTVVTHYIGCLHIRYFAVLVHAPPVDLVTLPHTRLFPFTFHCCTVRRFTFILPHGYCYTVGWVTTFSSDLKRKKKKGCVRFAYLLFHALPHSHCV